MNIFKFEIFRGNIDAKISTITKYVIILSPEIVFIRYSKLICAPLHKLNPNPTFHTKVIHTEIPKECRKGIERIVYPTSSFNFRIMSPKSKILMGKENQAHFEIILTLTFILQNKYFESQKASASNSNCHNNFWLFWDSVIIYSKTFTPFSVFFLLNLKKKD